MRGRRAGEQGSRGEVAPGGMARSGTGMLRLAMRPTRPQSPLLLCPPAPQNPIISTWQNASAYCRS